MVREKALFDFQNPAEFIQLEVGKKNIAVDLKIKQTQSRSH